jgi:CRISPR/Cas system CMR subunit Cmr4 (Cas7 group RAMP superfamily)
VSPAEATTGAGHSIGSLAGIGGNATPLTVWRFGCELLAVADVHLGARTPTGTPSQVDAALNRLDGTPVLAGTTLAGLLRHHLDDRRLGYTRTPGVSHPETTALFGGAADNDNASRFLMHDTPARGCEALRISVTIDADRGTAAATGLFEHEVLEAGTTLDVLGEIHVLPGDDEHQLVAAALDALDGLTESAIRLGARTHTGYGMITARRWSATRLDVRKPGGWRTWKLPPLETQRATSPAAGAHSSPSAAFKAAHPPIAGTLDKPRPDRRRCAVAAVRVDLTGRSLLIRDLPDLSEPNPPDSAHRFTSQPTDPDLATHRPAGADLQGPSLAGVLRAAARLTLSGITDNDAAAVGTLANLWGDEPGSFSPRPARLRVSEAVLAGAAPLRVTRNRIDPLIGDTVDTALFTDQVAVGGVGHFTVEIRDPSDADLAQLAFALRALDDGLIPVGGAVGIGHGDLTGRVSGNLSWPSAAAATALADLWTDPASPLPGWARALFRQLRDHDPGQPGNSESRDGRDSDPAEKPA